MKIKLSTPAEVRRTLSKIANMLLNNEIDPQRATAITNCCNSVLNCIRIDEQQKKLAELEKLLEAAASREWALQWLKEDGLLARMKKMMKIKKMTDYFAASPSGKMILFTKKKMTIEMPPLSTVVPML